MLKWNGVVKEWLLITKWEDQWDILFIKWTKKDEWRTYNITCNASVGIGRTQTK